MAYKEIVTKAVVGKGKKKFKNNYFVDVDSKPTTVLGCWVINHKFKGYKKDNLIGVDGSFDVNIWFSYENDTKTSVVTKTINYNDLFNVSIKESSDLTKTSEIIVRSLSQPSCSQVNIEDGKITFLIEKELGVEVVGETKVKIAVELDEEPWEELNEPENIDNIDDINENYMDVNQN